MRSNTVESIKSVDVQTRVQYGMMIVFGTLCLVAAAAPLDLLIKVTAVSTLFGLTAGLWISHLVQITQRVAIQGEGAT
jgi:intracellular septation protein A